MSLLKNLKKNTTEMTGQVFKLGVLIVQSEC